MKKPTVFISSTIYDFKDLRSCLKFYLETQGYEVLASEYNDFKKPFDIHSYEACIDALKKADYFILLIGSRIGGWFDQNEKISITQHEYREAYELMLKGKIKIINFVRGEVWQAIDDRKEYLKKIFNIISDEETKEKIEQIDGKYLENYKFIKGFIREVGKNEETIRALQQKKSFPKGNWIHTFYNFRDIYDVLKNIIQIEIPIDEIAIRSLLKNEIKGILRTTLIKFPNLDPGSPKSTVYFFHKDVSITEESLKSNIIEIPYNRWSMVTIISVHLLSMNLSYKLLSKINLTPIFYKYDSQRNDYEQTIFSEALKKLENQLDVLFKNTTPELLSIIPKYSPANYGVNSIVCISPAELIPFIRILEHWSNVVDLSVACINFLDGFEMKMPTLFEESMVEGMQKKIDKELVTDEEIEKFINNFKI